LYHVIPHRSIVKLLVYFATHFSLLGEAHPFFAWHPTFYSWSTFPSFSFLLFPDTFRLVVALDVRQRP
jgi:hypothetical protein